MAVTSWTLGSVVVEGVLDEVPRRAMAVFAHPADAEIACGATLARWTAAGCAISLVICTQGDKGSHEPDAEARIVAATRFGEVESAAEVLGIAELDRLDYPDGDIENTAVLRGELVGRVRAWRPDVVFGHDPTALFFGSSYVNHHDHRAVGFALCDAVAPMAASPLYYPDHGEPHRVSTLLLSGTLEADVWVDVAGSLDVKSAALRSHRTQVGDNDEGVASLVRRRAAEGRSRTGLDATEGFRRIDLAL